MRGKRRINPQERIIKEALGFERALHRWDKWLDSVAHGRQLFKPSKPNPSSEEMRNTARQTLIELGFTPCTFFELYWLCCVFSKYESKGRFYFEKLTLPDWFPYPHGFKHYDYIDLRGKRIYPPEVWTEADVQFRRDSETFHLSFNEPERSQFLEEMVPDRDWVIVLPSDHPVRKHIRRGRPITTLPDGGTDLE